MKKLLSLLLVISVFAGCFSLSASAVKNGDVVFAGFETPILYDSNTNHKENAKNVLSSYVSLSELRTVMLDGISNCRAVIDISKFSIPYNETNCYAISDYVWYALPEAFNAYQMGFSYYEGSNMLAQVSILYRDFADTAAEYNTCMNAITAAGNEILSGIEGNSNIGSVEKALLIHDRLALWNEYDYSTVTPDESFTAYGALGKQVSVCQGYAMAYMYLLGRVGIDSYYCSSVEMNHGWNIVYINNKTYHVDVTWDDYAWEDGARGAVGTVMHDNFLRSTSGIKSTGHDASDFDDTPSDTTYDNGVWQNSIAAFQVVGDKLYYVDNANSKLMCYSDGKTLCSLEKEWWADAGSYYGNYSCLSSDGKSLYYSMTKSIYKYDLTTGTSKAIYTPTLKNYYNIYSFTYNNGYLICDINNAPPYASDADPTANLYQLKQKYVDTPAAKPTTGDINGDGDITTMDLGVLMQYLNNWEITVDANIADVNGDGDVDTRDYGLLMQYVNGWGVTIR